MRFFTRRMFQNKRQQTQVEQLIVLIRPLCWT